MRVITRVAAVLAGAAFIALGASDSAAAGKIPWQKDLKKAQALAAKHKKIIMVDFTAPW